MAPLGLGQELILPDEDDVIERVVAANMVMMKHQPRAAERAQHPKGHGCLPARFTILDDIPDDCRIGLFAKPGTYDTWVRFSNGIAKNDRKPDGHGFAFRLLGVDGPKLMPDTAEPDSHDFVLMDKEHFFTADLAGYAEFNEKVGGLIGAVRNRDRILPPAVGALYYALHRHGRAMLKAAGQFAGQKPKSLLTESYWSTTPYRFGDRAVKYTAIPEIRDDDAVFTGDGSDALTDGLRKTLALRPAYFTFGVNLQTDPVLHPVEDPTVSWNANGSPFIPLARIELLQTDGSRAANRRYDRRLGFNPWNALPEHRPLGGINRIRRVVYHKLARWRQELNHDL